MKIIVAIIGTFVILFVFLWKDVLHEIEMIRIRRQRDKLINKLFNKK